MTFRHADYLLALVQMCFSGRIVCSGGASTYAAEPTALFLLEADTAAV